MSKVFPKEYKRKINYLQKIGFKRKQAHSIMRQYAEKEGLKRPEDISGYFLIADHMESNWQGFMNFYGTIKHNYPNRIVKTRKGKTSYSDWWNEKNLDGTFAYNGVTDDF